MTVSKNTSTVRTGAHWGMFEAEVSDGRLVGVRAFEGDPTPSPIIAAMPSAIHHESRIHQPMVRAGYLEHGRDSDPTARGTEPFVPVSWDGALDLVADELGRVKADHGNEAIYASSGWASAGCFHNAEAQLKRFMNLHGGFVSQVTNYSFGAATVIVPRVVGTLQPVVGPVTAWPTIAKNTRLMVLFGGMAPKNTQINKDGIGRHDFADWLDRICSAGVEFVSISPLRDDASAGLDAQWLPIRPNTDSALMLGIMHALASEGLHDAAFLDRYCTGFDRFLPYLMGETDGTPKTPAWAAAITEIDAEIIRTLARRMAATRTLISVSWSVQRADHGEQPYWLAITLAAMLGQIGLPGGGFGFGYGAINGIGVPRQRVPVPKLPVGENPVKAFIPVARASDMLLDPGGELDFNGQRLTYPDIRLVYWCGGNPFHKQQDLNRLCQAWAKPETIVIHEPWWTPAARRADIVLPCATTMERNDIGATAFDSYYFAMQKAIEPVGDSRSEYAIYGELADRLGFREAFTEGRTEIEWLRYIYDVARQQAAELKLKMPGFDAFWEAGHITFPEPEDPPVLFEDFRRDPVANALKTPSGRIEIFSETIDGFGYDDCTGTPQWREPSEWLGADKAADYPLHMISNQPRFRLHSQLDCGSVSQGGKVAGREPVQINTDDAAARGIVDGDVVRLYNDRGACLAGAAVTDTIRPGVIQLSTGAWYDPEDPAQSDSLDKHGNPNMLTLDKGTSKLSQCCTAQSCLVEIEKYEGDVPDITAFDQPALAQ